jgi:dihydrofolate reductase
MAKVRVSFSLSLDGFGAGPDQSLQDPLGKGGMAMHQWALATRTFRWMHGGGAGGSVGVDDGFAAASMANMGAWILGRNMFGPVRGPWPDETWKGWWGDDPPYHVPTFVLTHHARAPIEMKGGTTFVFVTDGIHAALEEARAAAGGKDIRIGGGVSTVRQYVKAGLVDEMHLAISNALLGSGEHFFAGLDLPARGFTVARRQATELATHVVLTRA